MPGKTSPSMIQTRTRRGMSHVGTGRGRLGLLLKNTPSAHVVSLTHSGPFSSPSASQLILVCVMIVAVLLLIPTVGLDNVALSHVHQQVRRVNIQHTFNTAHKRLLQRILTRGLIIALVKNMLKLVLSCVTILYVHS